MENALRDLKERTAELVKIKDNSRIIAAFIYGLKVGMETKEEVTENG